MYVASSKKIEGGVLGKHAWDKVFLFMRWQISLLASIQACEGSGRRSVALLYKLRHTSTIVDKIEAQTKEAEGESSDTVPIVPDPGVGVGAASGVGVGAVPGVGIGVVGATRVGEGGEGVEGVGVGEGGEGVEGVGVVGATGVGVGEGGDEAVACFCLISAAADARVVIVVCLLLEVGGLVLSIEPRLLRAVSISPLLICFSICVMICAGDTLLAPVFSIFTFTVFATFDSLLPPVVAALLFAVTLILMVDGAMTLLPMAAAAVAAPWAAFAVPRTVMTNSEDCLTELSTAAEVEFKLP